MTLNTENFRKLGKIISLFSSPDDKKHQCIFFDFEESKGYLLNPSFGGRFDFEFDGEAPSNFFVDTQKFLNLCNEYETIDISKTNEFSHGEDKFKLFHFTETFDLLDFDVSDYTKYTLTADTMNKIKAALPFMGANNDIGDNYAGLSLSQTTVVTSTPGTRVFIGSVDTSYPEMKIPSHIIRLITIAEDLGVDVYFKENTNNIIISIDNGKMMILSPTVNNLIVPNVFESDFVEIYDHATFFVLRKEELIDILSFFEGFVRNINNQPIYFTIESETSLVIEVKGDETGMRKLPLKTCSKELVGSSFLLIRDIAAVAFTKIDDEFIKIQFSPKKPIAINIVGETQTDKHIALVTLSE